MSYPQIIIIASHLPILITAVYAASHFRRFDDGFRIFCLFVFLSCAIQMTSLLLWFMKRNNMPLLHLYVPVGFALLSLFFKSLLNGYINVKIIVLTMWLFIAFSVVNSLLMQDIFTFNSNALTVQSVIIIVLSIFTFIVHLREIVNDGSKPGIRNLNWIITGLFIYYTSTLCLFYFGDVIMRLFSVDSSAYAWIFHSFFSILMYTLFFIGLWRQTHRLL